MTSFREPETPSIPNSLADFKVSLPLPTHLAISATTAPLLGLLVSGHRVAHALTQLGVSSEEIFRGDRLPILPLLPKNEVNSESQRRQK